MEQHVKKEAAALFATPGSTPTLEQMDTMEWTLATLKEVLRLYSVVPVVTRVTVVRIRIYAALSVPGAEHACSLNTC